MFWTTRLVYSDRKSGHFEILVSVEVHFFCYPPDLYYELSPFKSQVEELQEDGKLKTEDQALSEQEQVEPKELKDDEESFKKLKTDDQPSDEQENEAELKQNELFIPNLIVRTLEGKNSAVIL